MLFQGSDQTICRKLIIGGQLAAVATAKRAAYHHLRDVTYTALYDRHLVVQSNSSCFRAIRLMRLRSVFRELNGAK